MSSDNQEPPEREKKTFEPLNDAQIEYAHELLQELHPLDDTPLCTAFPLLGFLNCCSISDVPRRRSEIEAEQHHALDSENKSPMLMKKKTTVVNGKEVPKKKKRNLKINLFNKERVKKDPLAKLGFGIVAYVDTLQTLIIAFFIFSILLLPTMSFYRAGTGYKNMDEQLSKFEHGTLGNMGYSSVQCTTIPLEIGGMTLQCPYGYIGELYDSGVNLSDLTASNCASHADIDQCKPDSVAFANAIASSIGKEAFVYKFSDWQTLYQDPQAKTNCFKANNSRLFLQYTCIQTEESQALKYDQMCLVVATGVLIAFLFSITVRQMNQSGNLERIDWDLITTNISDFTVEFKIDQEKYQEWKSGVYEAAGGPSEQGISPALAFKTQMKAEIETIIDEHADQSTVNDGDYQRVQSDSNLTLKSKNSINNEDGPKNTQVADIVFSFKNQELISALRTRGTKIASHLYNRMRDQNQKIKAMLEDDQKLDELTTPTSAFITFESDHSKLSALSGIKDKTLIGQPFEVTEAPEPTQIIWQNRHFTTQESIFRKLVAAVVLSVCMFGSWLIIYMIKNYGARISSVFPAENCAGIKASYTGDIFQEYAVDDFNFISAHEGEQSFGTLQCWCQQEKESNPDTYMSDSYGQKDGTPICFEYQNKVDTFATYITALSYILVFINKGLKKVCIILVNWIGYPTETERLGRASSVIFYLQVFNAAILPVLINANLSEQPFSFGLTGGKLGDFNQAWFQTVGNILIGAMIVNMYWPIVKTSWDLFWRLFGRCKDRSWRCPGGKTTTKKTSIQGYMDVYSGPIAALHLKYGSIMTITFITFIYGFGAPILFPIACVSFLILYVLEKLLLFYGYRLPPMYDERLSKKVFSMLQIAPLIYLAVGYWMASNKQLLSNDYLEPLTATDQVKLTNHTYGTIFKSDGWTGFEWPMLTAFILILIMYFFGDMIRRLINRCCCKLHTGEIEYEEFIDNYWASLDDHDRKWSIREEENVRSYRTSILTDSQFERLQKTPKTTSKKTLQGVHSYDILANPLNQEDFQYVAADEDNRNQMIIDDDEDETNDAVQSDLVRMVLNLAYLHESEVRNFKFCPKTLRETADEGIKGYSNTIL